MITPMGPDQKNRRLEIAAANILRLELLKKIGRAFREEGMPLLALKGMALLGCEYDDISGRGMVDIDVLVHPGDKARAIKLLLTNGARIYRFPPGREPNPEYYQTMYLLDRGNVELVLELHTGFVTPLWYPVDYGKIINASVPHPLSDLAGAGVRRPSPEHMLVHLAIHRLKDSYNTNLCDAESGLRIFSEHDVDIDALMRDATEWRLRTAVYFFLLYLRERSASLRAGGRVSGQLDNAIKRFEPSRFRRKLISLFLDPQRPNMWKVSINRSSVRIVILFWLFSHDPLSAVWLPLYTAIWRRKRFIRKLIKCHSTGGSSTGRT